jgi:hypothetical protein
MAYRVHWDHAENAVLPLQPPCHTLLARNVSPTYPIARRLRGHKADKSGLAQCLIAGTYVVSCTFPHYDGPGGNDGTR